MDSQEQQSYPKTAQSAINRHRERAHYDTETVNSIFNSTPVAHVSFVPDPSDPVPVVLPMIARIGTYPSSPDASPALYIHGYISARMLRPSTASAHGSEGLPICAAATKIVNLVLALTPFNHSYDYRSAVIHGHDVPLDPVTDRDEVLWAMRLITDGIVPGRWAHTRTPPDNVEIASTRIMRVRIDAASAKVRDSGVKNDAKDAKREDVVGSVWTGTIPYVETLGEPRPAEDNRVVEVPGYIREFVDGTNEAALAESGGGGEGKGKGIVSKVVAAVFGR